MQPSGANRQLSMFVISLHILALFFAASNYSIAQLSQYKISNPEEGIGVYDLGGVIAMDGDTMVIRAIKKLTRRGFVYI